MNAKIKILIAEHDPVDVELIRHELKAGGINYVSEVVTNERDFIDALNNFIPHVILADYTFPSFSGPMAFKIREQIAPDTPFIFVSGTIGEERSIELIKTGVTDYALKDKLFTLNFKVNRALKEAKDKQRKKIAEEKLILSEKWLARAQQVAHIGSWGLDFFNDTVRLSDEGCRIYGLLPTQNQHSFKDWLSYIHPEDLDLVVKKIKNSRSSLLDFSINYCIVHKEGSTRHIFLESKAEFDLSDQPMGLYGTMRDVTQTVLLERELVKERHTKQSEITAAVLEAQENERADIGKELHDNLNQVLGAAKLYIERAKTDVANRQMLLQKSTAYIVDVIENIRKISKLLGKPGKQARLFDCIKNLIDDIAVIHPLRIQFDKRNIDEASLDDKLQLTIFRIVQEQMNNILKHARATSASITLKKIANEIMLLISDNGEGTDFLKEVEGVGIKNIISRAHLYNGKVTIVSKPGKGYELKVALSLSDYMNQRGLSKAIVA